MLFAPYITIDANTIATIANFPNEVLGDMRVFLEIKIIKIARIIISEATQNEQIAFILNTSTNVRYSENDAPITVK